MEEGDEVGAKASMATLQAFNLCVLHLGRLARDRGASRFITDGLQAFSQLVPFASAWWGEMSASGVDVSPRNWMHGRINLPESFAAEWHTCARNDKFSHDTISRPGEVVRDSGFNDPNEDVNVFARRYDLYYLMCITFELPESGMMFFVCLYRGIDASAFNESEADLFFGLLRPPVAAVAIPGAGHDPLRHGQRGVGLWCRAHGRQFAVRGGQRCVQPSNVSYPAGTVQCFPRR